MTRLLPLVLVPLCATAFAEPKPAPFSAKLHPELGKQRGNLLYSPASVAIALGMTREGARTTTADEMDKVLGAENRADAKALLALAAPQDHKPGEPMPPELAIANRIYAEKTLAIAPGFLEVTKRDWQAPAEQVDFKTAPEPARTAINRWVATQTHDKIQDLVPPNGVTNDTRMVLVNAIYLKAQWQTPFLAGMTRPSAFAVAGAKKHDVPTMHGVMDARWGAHAGARVLDVPYYAGRGPRLAMLLVVPDGKDLAAVESAYGSEGIQPFVDALGAFGSAQIALPKFEVASGSDLAKPLAALGIKRAFTTDADFSGLAKEPTKISAVFHKAWAKVDENGTEAAAATAVVMDKGGGAMQKPHDFAVDRSFLFFIHDDKGHVLFGGRIVDPAAK
jgi:serine protease inhibitor